MIATLTVALLSSPKSHPQPIFALNLDGKITSPTLVSWRAGTKLVPVPGGRGISFDGVSSGLMIRDHVTFAVQHALTVSAWINPSTYGLPGTGAQIFFRGDDRNGLDPYSFVLHPDGRIYFAIDDGVQISPNVSTDIPLNQWTHIVASFSAKTGEMRIYKDGEWVGRNKTKVVPLKELDSFCAPGVGVGNVQWNGGPHNQPFQGILADVRFYNAVLPPKAVGFNPKPWKNPTPSSRG